MTPPVLSATSCTPVEMHSDTEKKERDLHRLALHSRSGDISFVLSLTDPALIPARGRAREMVDNGGSSIPDGTWKDCQRHAHNEDGQIIPLSNVASDLLKVLEMDAPYYMGFLLCCPSFYTLKG